MSNGKEKKLTGDSNQPKPMERINMPNMFNQIINMVLG
jgi:hypothetical protein